MDRGTGTIIIAKPLDAEKKSSYNLTVEATDGTSTILTQVGEWLMAQNSGLGVHRQWGQSVLPSEVPISEVTVLIQFIYMYTLRTFI